jgi:cell wall assembly regulator SMI1
MGLLDSIKSFVHSITTEDHYASFDSPYRNSTIASEGAPAAAASSARLNELGRLATANSSQQSLGGGPVGYRPGMRLLATNLSGLDLQLQLLNRDGQPPLPLMDSLWHKIEAWLEEEYPELGDNLNDGVTTADLNEFENDVGCGLLPVEFRQFYKRHDGQMRGGAPAGLIMGLTLLDIESIVEEYQIWGKVAARLERQQYAATAAAGSSAAAGGAGGAGNNFLANQKSLPPQAVQCVYLHKGWIPFARDDGGNQIAVDLAPGPAGVWGQVILFGRDFDTKVVIAQLFQEFVFNFVSDLEAGNFQVDQGKEESGYLEISRDDDDYMIGAEDEGQGDLTFYDRSGKEFGRTNTQLLYIDVLKKRALRRYGISNVDLFQTSFVPQRVAREERPAGMSRATTPQVSSPLISMEASVSQVGLERETIIKPEAPEVPSKAPEVPSKALEVPSKAPEVPSKAPEEPSKEEVPAKAAAAEPLVEVKVEVAPEATPAAADTDTAADTADTADASAADTEGPKKLSKSAKAKAKARAKAAKAAEEADSEELKEVAL